MVLARVLGPLRQYAPKVAAPKGKGSAKKLDLSAKPFSVFDEAGLPIKDFKTFDDAMKFAKDQPSYTVGNTPKAGAIDAGKDAPALFYKSREALIDAPMEKMSADRWLAYLNARGIKKSELLDTSLGPFYSLKVQKPLQKPI